VLEGKKVSLEVRVPKKLRKQLRSAAKDADSTVDDIVTAAIASELRRRSQ
jgi:predicted HicB family RNase H-like nuclease